ncbi:MAG: radical SAM protein [Nitrospirae bacterium]|nr:radical SAM protein [Nitrospirota bacterium]
MLELIEFTVTSRCNARCRMCHMWQRRDPDIPLEKIKEVLGSRAVRGSLINLVLTGGEPTLRDDLPEIFRFAFEDLGRLEYATFFTNSLNPRLAQEAAAKIAAYRKQSGRKDVSFSVGLSLDGIGKTHDNVRGVDGAFGRVMENYLGLKALAERGCFDVGFNFTVQRENVLDGGAQAMLEAAEGALFPITFTLVYGKDVFLNRVNIDEWGGQDEAYRREVVRFYEEAARRADSGGLIIDNGTYYRRILSQLKGGPRTLPCLYKEKKACLVDADGSVYLCEVTKDSLAGNIYENNFDEIWNSKQKDSAYAKMLRHCPDCLSSCLGSGRYQLKEVWHSGGMAGIAKLSLGEFRKRMKRISRLMKQYRYAVIPRL